MEQKRFLVEDDFKVGGETPIGFLIPYVLRPQGESGTRRKKATYSVATRFDERSIHKLRRGKRYSSQTLQTTAVSWREEDQKASWVAGRTRILN